MAGTCSWAYEATSRKFGQKHCIYIGIEVELVWGPPIRNMHIYRVPDQSRRLIIFNGIIASPPKQPCNIYWRTWHTNNCVLVVPQLSLSMLCRG